MGEEEAPELRELLPALRSPDPKVRASAAGALGALGRDGVPALAPLLEACRDEDMYVRGEAVHSLWEIGGSLWDDEDPPARRILLQGLPTLIALLDDPWCDVRCSAMSVLQVLGPVAAPALPRLRSVLTDEPSNVTAHPEGWTLETEARLLRESAAEAIRCIEGAEER